MTIVLCCVGLLTAGHPYAGDPPEVVALYRKQVAVARRMVEMDRQIRDTGAIPKEEASAFMELELDGVRRLTVAECKLDPTPAGRLAAARTVLVCSRDMEAFYTARAERGLNREQVAMRASLFRLDAEVALRQAETAYPAHCPPVAAPFTAPPATYRGAVTSVDGDTPPPAASRNDRNPPPAGVRPPQPPLPPFPDKRLFAVEPITGLKRFDRLHLYHPGETKPYGELIVVVAAPSHPPHPDPQEPTPRVFGIVLASGGPAAAVRVGDEARP